MPRVSQVHEPSSPHEPEIEFLAKLARGGLTALRWVMYAAGIAALVVTVLRTATPGDEAFSTRLAHNLVWTAAGLPLLLPDGWTFGRGRWVVLAVLACIWFLPMLAAGDHSYGWVLRFAGTFCGTMTIFVWRTLASLSRGTKPA